jgi:succinate dehydrogenase / fumarate reductase, cytochrome b subunit
VAATLALYRSSIGKKAVMAVTGAIWFAYVLAHMYGNLKAFQGREYFNEYAIFLREMGAPLVGHEQLLWLARAVLVVSLVLHVTAAVQLARMDRVSRPVGYAQRRNLASSYAARTMIWGGIIIGLFIIYHILHLTTGTFLPGHAGHERAYENLVRGFQNPLATIIYLVAMAALGLHLYHGVWSMGATLGLRDRQNDALWRGVAVIGAVVVAGGFSLVPLAVLVGIIRL